MERQTQPQTQSPTPAERADVLAPLFDTHAHLDDERFTYDGGQEALIASLPEAGVRLCTCVGSDMRTSAQVVELARRYAFLYAAVGVHPHEAKDFREEDVGTLARYLTQEPKVRALGEIGLDYYYDHSARDVQREVFARQLDLAYELGVPACLHVRDAHGDTLDILRAARGRLPVFVLHCCSASLESARVYLDLGGYVSFAGPVTFKKAANLQQVARFVPDDRLLIETDSPYLAPEPVRGRRNDPRNVAHIARCLAGLRGVEPEALARQTFENGLRFYRIDPTA